MKDERSEREQRDRIFEVLQTQKGSFAPVSSPSLGRSRTRLIPTLPQKISGVTPQRERESRRVFSNAKIIPQKEGSLALEQLVCSSNSKYILRYLETHFFHGKTVRAYHVKELLIGMRTIKEFSQQMQRWISAQFCHTVEMTRETPEFAELIERREERHFQIDRIIRYLSS